MASCSGIGSKGHHKFTLNVTESYVSGGADNYSNLAWSLVLSPVGNGWDWYHSSTVPVTYSVIVNKTTVASGNIMTYDGTSTVTVASGTIKVTHNDDGSKTVPFSFSVSSLDKYYLTGSASGNGSLTLTTIPRYAKFTTHKIKSYTETTATITWGCDSACDAISYRLDGGEWVAPTGESVYPDYTITGLSPNTEYKIETRVKRTDSQLITESTALTVTTYNYPYCIEAPAFVIGEPISLGFYNPLGREFTFYIVCNGVEIDNNWTISGTSYYGLGAESTKNQLYATMPNSQNAKYSVITICDGYRINYSNPNSIISVDPTKCSPTGFEFYYADTNEIIKDVTGDDKTLVKGYSNLLVGVFAGDGAEAQYGATMSRYVFSFDTLSDTRPYLTDNVASILGVINSAGIKRLSVRAYDSRGLSSLAYNDITVYDYEKPIINADIKRLNNFEAQTTIKISGTYSRLTINGTDKNTITTVQYRYRETNGEWLDWVTLDTTVVTAGEFVCTDVYISLDNSKSFEFEIRATDKLDATTLPVTVDIGQAIFFISSNNKKCYINGVEVPSFETVYPIGSVFCNSTNTNPSEIYGGTWELIDKGFTSGSTETTQEATEYLSKFNVISIRGGNTIRLRINVTTAKDIAETTVSLGTVDLAKHGLTKDDTGFFPYTVYGGVAMSDGANAVILVYFTANGVLQTADAFQSDGTHALPANTPFYFDVVLPVTPSQMLDEFCDKFYWKRIT